jgi:protease-4
VEVRGEISAETEASAEILVGALKSAFEDQQRAGRGVAHQQPGGSPVQAGIVYDEIKRLKAKHNKKVYAVVEEMCASGAYYIAVAADEIYVDKASIVGSIGVLMDGFGFVGLMDKLGVERRLLTSGDNKGMLDPFSPENPRQTAVGQGHHRADPPPVHCGGERRPR